MLMILESLISKDSNVINVILRFILNVFSGPAVVPEPIEMCGNVTWTKG